MLISLLGVYFVCRRLAPQITLISGTWDRFERQSAYCICYLKMSPSGENWQEEGTPHRNRWCNCSSPWQMLVSEVPLMWKPASQLQCCSWFTWAQRGLRLKAGSFMTLHSGGAALRRRADESCLGQTKKQNQNHGFILTCLGLVLAVRSTPPLGAGAPVLINPFHTGTSILARIAGTLAHDCRWRTERSLQPSFMLSSRRSGRHPVNLLSVFNSISTFEGYARAV